MELIANLLDRAKAGACIESDYRLSKVIGITHSVISGYRSGKSMPNEKILTQLCALSGDDVAVIAAQIQAARSKTPEAVNMWLMIAKRLSTGASTAILSVLFAIGLVALPAQEAKAAPVQALKTETVNLLYIVFSGVFVRWGRLRRFGGLWRLSLWLN